MGFKPFRAGADLECPRHIKLNGSSGDTVVYAGDGEAFIGITGRKSRQWRYGNFPGPYGGQDL